MSKNKNSYILIILGVIFTLLACIFIINSKQNKAISLDEQVNKAQSDIQVQEKRRVDLVYNLVDTVKQYDKHEAQTLQSIVEGRSKKGDIENVNTLISAVSESYPELKSNENYKQLMLELSVTENLIAEHRSNYNNQVTNYNRYVKKFPNKQFLSILGYDVKNLKYLHFEAPSTAPQNLFESEGK